MTEEIDLSMKLQLKVGKITEILASIIYFFIQSSPKIIFASLKFLFFKKILK